ncbi:hypothetical protein RG959_22930 [Domibacillus sp. 8LH]|uniref:hypothetical protein n=1 Tax=Domibacillus sp. 8LH TaxID=3073900 RepID=UPI00316DCA0F
MRKGLGDWFFIVPGTDDTFSYMEGIYTYRLTPDYSIEMGKRNTKPGYTVLNLPATYFLTYKIMDLLYKQVPGANQERVRNVLECEALSIESEEELLPILLSVDIKEWL